MSTSQDPFQKPGAKKIYPINLKALKQLIDALLHGKKRTAETGALYHTRRIGISRREFNDLVREIRRETNRQQSTALCRVGWLRPDLAWALDGFEYRHCHVQNLQDLHSRYKSASLTTDRHPCGETVAGHLSHLLSRFGPPLFIKGDNGGNLNHPSVNDLLEEIIIIPINSPVCTASYNGAIKHSQGELKT